MKAERRASSERLVAGYRVTQTEPEILNVLSDSEIRALVARERARFPFVDGKELLAIVENSDEMKRHRLAVRQAQAAARRSGSTVEVAKRARDEALDQLRGKAEELRKAMPTISEEQAFSTAYRMFPELARAERSASRSVLFG
jgi:hypothetical protein